MGKRRNPIDPPAEYRFKPGGCGNPGGHARGEKISTTYQKLLDMTDVELAAFRKRVDLTQCQRKALKWLDSEPEDCPQLHAMALDRTEGSVAQQHVISESPRRALSDAEFDDLCRRRQNRKAGGQ